MSNSQNKISRFISDADYRRNVVEGPIRNLIQRKRYEMGYAPYPQTITIYLTNQCNLRCKMCAQWGDNGANFSQPKLYMETRDMEKLFNEVAFFRPTIVIMGGEPMLSKDWLKTIQIAHDKNIPCSMITNGMFIEKNAEAIVECGLEDLNLSVDGPEEIHDMIRKSPGGFKKIMAGIDAINRVKAQTGKSHPNINIFFTITGMNYTTILELADILKGKGINRYQLQHLWFEKEETFQAHNKEFIPYFGGESTSYNGFVYEPGTIDPNVLISQLKELRTVPREFKVLVNPAHPDAALVDYYSKPVFERKVLRDCVAIWNSITIGPQGEVQPCLDYYCGNIRTEKLLDIWNSKKLRYFRKVRKEHGPFPLCHRCCA